MARATSAESGRFELRLKPADKQLLARAAELQHTDMSGFILSTAIPAAATVVEKADRVELSEARSLQILALLENPPAPAPSLVAAAERLRKRQSETSVATPKKRVA